MARIVLASLWTALLMGVAVAAEPSAPQADGSSLRLVPFPKEVTLVAGGMSLDGAWVMRIPAGLATLGQSVAEEWQRAGFRPPKLEFMPEAEQHWSLFRAGSSPPFMGNPQFATEDNPEEYQLVVVRDGVVAHARSQPGLFYAAMSFCQLLRANRTDAGTIPCVQIRDWPTLRWRCFQDDLTRGPSTTLPSLKRSLELGVFFKYNLWTYYMEYQYAFRKHPEIGPPDGSLQPQELAALVEHGKKFFVEIVGNQQSFGHFHWILRHEKFAHLREQPHLLTPVREETYQLLDDLYSEVCPILPFPMFNVCCDETWGLGEGQSKELARKIGVGGVYVQHIRRVHALLRDKYNKRMMMWGDIILQHPENLKDIPPDVIMLAWNYSPLDSFEHLIVPFRNAGFEFFVCPGIHNWSRILPDFGVAMKNIQNFVRDGVRLEAAGMINTDWEDDGEALQGYRWHGHAWGAECAWNGGKTEPADFHRRIGAVLFGEKGDHFGRAIELLAQTHRLPNMEGMNNRRFWRRDFISTDPPEAVRASADKLLTIVRPAIAHLEACRKEATVNADLVDSFLHGARRMELIGRRMLAGLEVQDLYRKAQEASPEESLRLLNKARLLVSEIRDAHQALGEEFARLWLADCKPYALEWTMSRYRATVAWYDELLKKLADAEEAVRQGNPVPPAQAVGLVPAAERR